MTADLLKVGAELLAIPDGATVDKLRIGIQITPSVQVAGGIVLQNWSGEIAALAENIRIRFGTLSAGTVAETGSVLARSALGDFFDLANQWNGKSRRDAASAMWQDVFDPVGFQALIDAISQMGSEKNFSSLQFASTRTADLQLFLDALLGWHELEMPGGAQALTPRLKSFASQISNWMAFGPNKDAPKNAVSLGSSPMADRSKQIELLKEGFALLFTGSSDGASALRFLNTYEADIGTMFRDHWIRLFGQATVEEPTDEPDTSGWGSGLVEAASRKLSALLALPTLSHYLGLGVQVEIARSSLQGLSFGAICAEFADQQGNRVGDATAWTAFELVDNHFGPAPDPSASTVAGMFSQGLLNLNARIDGGSQRFLLRSNDVVNTLHDLVQAVRNDEDPVLKQFRRGLTLYDLGSHQRLIEEEKRASNGTGGINYLNDLLAGLRPDFGVATRGASSLKISPDRWRPVTSRTIVCNHEDLDPAFYLDPTVGYLKSRDNGYATALVEEKDGALSREDEMFNWPGESLAVHAKRQGDYRAPDPKRDLALHLTYALPDPSSELGMPPLREKIGYGCGCRLVYVNGAGADFATASAIYGQDTTFVIGSADGKPYIFPSAPLPPPDVHLPWDDRLVRANDLDREVLGESSETLVIRDGVGTARRFVTPARGTFDSAEQQRQLDDPGLKDNNPHGALAGTKGVWLFGADGKFPEARFGAQLGGIRYLDGTALKDVRLDGRTRPDVEIGSGDYKKIKHPQSRGTVLILGRRRGLASPEAPFFPDSNGARLRISASSLAMSGSTAAPQTTDRDFWKAPQRPFEAVPMVIDIGSADALSFGTAREVTVVDIDNRHLTLPYIQVHLPKAEKVCLRLKGDARRGDEAEARLTLIHAVEKPLRTPDFHPKEVPEDICTTNGIGLRAVTLTIQSDDPEIGRVDGLQTWAEKVRDFEASGLDMRCWPSEEGGATTFFTGRVDLDRKSTGVLRCEAAWTEFNQGTVSRVDDQTWITNLSPETAQLFKFEVERRGSEGRLDLLRIPPLAKQTSAEAGRHTAVTGVPGELRTLSYAFRDGRARKLQVKMVATSAFTPFYPKESNSPTSDEWIGRYEVESSRFSTASPIWTDCTFRPPPPVIDRMLPLFAWDKIPDQAESLRRVAHLRIFLGEGWYASGEGEQLGVVLLSGDDPETVCDYQSGELAAFHRFITQAGSDPVREASPVPLRIEARHFRNPPSPVDAMLYLPSASNAAGENSGKSKSTIPLPVTVLPYSPRFSEKDGLYCDLELDMGDSYTPFLRLGLVRYQEHSVDQLQLSNPIAFDVQLLPERRVWVEFDPNGIGRRTVVVEGPGFDVPDLGQPAHKENSLRLSLMSWHLGSQDWREDTVIEEAMAPEIDSGSHGYRWRKDFTLPVIAKGDRFLLQVEEYEWLPLDEATGTYNDGEAVFQEANGKRLVFSGTLPLIYPRRS